MSKLINIMQDVYKPYAAIIAYRTDNRYENGRYYLERRSIRNGRMGAGKPLTERDYAKLMRNVQAGNAQLDNSIHGVVPRNLLYCSTSVGDERLVWYHEPEERHVYFKEGLGIPDGRMNVPGLLWAVKNDELQMFAFKGRKPTGRLFRAPFMNVSEEYVCLGNSKVRKPDDRTFANVIDYWEKMFWLSEFSHILGGNPIKGNLAVLTKRLIETGGTFPSEVLIPVKMTLKEMMK